MSLTRVTGIAEQDKSVPRNGHPRRASPSGCPPQHPRTASHAMPATGRSPGLRAMRSDPHHPDTFPRNRSGIESGVLAYRCGGSAGMESVDSHRLPVSPCSPVRRQDTCGRRSVGVGSKANKLHCAKLRARSHDGVVGWLRTPHSSCCCAHV
ncbi:hypothetical protein LA76x_3375 [Lysobacter antibioticus]|uniref:Uncharacterized protein n=1 Tax=Lysobacter antibioticus TaxID=84531 RepID=A0A0S2FDJ8_LYSAN|nr:hypothetical protein LA76x_3375 [Lysobacter antibioticus]